MGRELSERVRVVRDGVRSADASFVLYWMHHAVRGHENPALDVAVAVGNHFGLPVLVYQGLAGTHEFNSDRHHTFIMEGARSVQRELSGRGIAYRFFLGAGEHMGSPASPLPGLMARAALVVTEEFPVPPFTRWYQTIASNLAGTGGPGTWAVDAHCILPMQTVDRSFDRAFEFRKQWGDVQLQRARSGWQDVEPAVPLFNGLIGFDAVDFSNELITDLCAACDIDHAVGPLPETPGGSDAGYRRWDLFKEHGLSRYASLRNDPTVMPPLGVSRLSPYLHHGHISPFRIAREAAAHGSSGAKKYLDELLVWRELSYNKCFHAAQAGIDIESLEALPQWARSTLVRHARDERHRLSWETLSRGETGDVLWDLAQKSLRRHGELHNNVRMTWGKALLGWTRDPAEALSRLIELNHRYALDGSDPNSYGGILWSLGLFDRPFQPEVPVLGTVRPRSTEAHAERLDLERYAARVNRSPRGDGLSVAVVGAGMSGLSAARALHDSGVTVRVFEKSRGPGGRMATRRVSAALDGDAIEFAFDHGAQYFTVRHPVLKRYVASWRQDGIVERWQGRLGVSVGGTIEPKQSRIERFVGAPKMSSLTRHLSNGLDIAYSSRITDIRKTAGRWQIDGESFDREAFDVVIMTVPPEQAVPLLADAPAMAAKVRQVKMAPCWSVMVVFDQRLSVDFDGLFVNSGPLSWVSRNSSKPGRPQPESWVLHAAPEWSRDHLEVASSDVEARLLAAYFSAIGEEEQEPVFVRAHRWRYALADNPLDAVCLWNADLQIAVCGDWCNNSRVEGAFLSGAAAAGRVMGIPDARATEAVGLQASLF